MPGSAPPPTHQTWQPPVPPIPARRPPLAPAARPLPAPVAPPGPPRQIRWREFLEKNQITILAYLGGLLLLVATIFIVTYNGLLPWTRPLIVLGISLLFGALGWAVRRTRLRAVGRVYLLVCALTTPLVGLATYLTSRGAIPFAWLLTFAALYAWLIYLALAWETRFVTYAYVGWVFLILAAAALVFALDTAGTAWQWLMLTADTLTLAFLVPRFGRQPPSVALLAQSATLLAAWITTPAALLWAQVFSAIALVNLLRPASSSLNPSALVLGDWALLAVIFCWHRLIAGQAVERRNTMLGVIDGLSTLLFAEAIEGTIAALGLGATPSLILFACVGLVEFGWAAALARRQPQRDGLRHVVEGLALAVTGMAALLSLPLLLLHEPHGQWPLVVALSILGVILVGLAVLEQAWWLVPGVLALRLAYQAALEAWGATPDATTRITTEFLLALACWSLALLVLGGSERTRRLAPPTYVVALGFASYTTILIFLLLPSAPPASPLNLPLENYYSVFIMLCFGAAGFLAGLKERQSAFGSILLGGFGLLVPLPLIINDRLGWDTSVLALLCALVVLWAGRRAPGAGRYAMYGTALYIGALAAIHSGLPGVATASSDWLSLSFTTWFLLLFAFLASWAALLEGSPWAVLVPASLAFWATTLAVLGDPVAGAVLTFTLLGFGAVSYVLRGANWGRAFQFAALLASGLEGVHLFQLDPMGYSLGIFLLVFALAAYLTAILEHQPALTGLAALYALLSLFLLPGTDLTQQFWLTALLTGALALVGLTLRLPGVQARVRRAWALAPYGVALVGSLLVFGRGLLAASAWLWLALLSFAIAAYLGAALEREPAYSLLAVPYALAAGLFLPSLSHPVTSTGANFIADSWFIPNEWDQIALTIALSFSLWTVGLLLRQPSLRRRVQPAWALAPYGAAAGCSFLALERGAQGTSWVALSALALAAAAYLSAWLERKALLTSIAALYMLVACWFLPALTPQQPAVEEGVTVISESWFRELGYQFWLTWALTLLILLAAVVLRLFTARARDARAWALAPYLVAISCSLLALQRGVQAAPLGVALALLSFATATYLVATLEHEPRLTGLAAVYGLLAALFLPNLHALSHTAGFAFVNQFAPTFEQFVLTVIFTLAFIALGMTLRQLARAWALAPYAVAFGGSLLLLWRGLLTASALLWLPLLGLAVLAYLAAVLERQPVLTALAALYALLAALLLPGPDTAAFYAALGVKVGAADNFVLTVGLTFGASAFSILLRLSPVRQRVYHAWMLAPYATAVGYSLLTLERALQSSSPWVPGLLVAFALVAYAAVALERQPWLTAVSVVYALVGVALLPGSDQAALYQKLALANTLLPQPYQVSVTLGFTLAFTATGVLLRLPSLRRRVQSVWALAPLVTAFGCSLLVLMDDQSTNVLWLALPLLGLAVLAYLLAVLEKTPAVTLLTDLYALIAAFLIPPDQAAFYKEAPLNWLPGAYQFWLTAALVLLAAVLAVAIQLASLRAHIQQKWAWSLYGTAVGCSLLAIWRIPNHDAGRTQALLLVFAALAYLIVLLEGRPWVGVVPALYALAGVVIYPEPDALLPLALGLALLGLLTGRVADIRWSWPFYGGAAVAASLTAVLGEAKEGLEFEAIALLSLALLSYLIAAIESRADMLPIALVLGALALSSGLNFFDLKSLFGAPAATAEAISAFIILGWLYILGQYLWEALPLRPRGILWWVRTNDPAQLPRWRDPRFVGVFLHRWAGVLLGCGSAFAALGNLLPFLASGGTVQAFQSPQPLVSLLALLALAGMLALLGRTPRFRIAWYFAGGMLALAIGCLMLWMGVSFSWENAQALLLAPGSYLLVIGALLPADHRLGNPGRVGQVASLAGALLLLLPALILIFSPPPATSLDVYLLVLLAEALGVAIWGLVIHSPLLVALGFALIGIAAVALLKLAGTSGSLFIGLVLVIVSVLLLIFVPLWHYYLHPRQATARQ
jgi:hypothetical protein